MTKLKFFRVNRPKVINETLDGESIMIHLETGNYYSLNETGSYILDLIEKNASIDWIGKFVSERYEADGENVEEAVSQLIAELKEENLIVPNEEEGKGHPAFGQISSVSGKTEKKIPFQKPMLEKYTDMQELLLLDPIHEVDETGWPHDKNGN